MRRCLTSAGSNITISVWSYQSGRGRSPSWRPSVSWRFGPWRSSGSSNQRRKGGGGKELFPKSLFDVNMENIEDANSSVAANSDILKENLSAWSTTARWRTTFKSSTRTCKLWPRTSWTYSWTTSSSSWARTETRTRQCRWACYQSSSYSEGGWNFLP